MKQILLAAVGIIIIGLVAYGAFYYGSLQGKQEGKQQIDAQVEPLLDAAFPPPPDDIRSFSGIVKGVYGSKFDIEITSLSDYLPRLDGTAQQKEIRTVTVTAATKILSIDPTKLDENGNPAVTAIQLSAIKTGTPVTVRSGANIRDAKAFEATQIEFVSY